MTKITLKKTMLSAVLGVFATLAANQPVEAAEGPMLSSAI